MTSTQTTSYTYDVFGNLLHVGFSPALADGTRSIDYVVDGENRRVGKQVNGTLTSGYLYQDGLNVVVQLDASGNVVSRFVFGTKPNVPDYYTTASGTFRILSDHLGSPRLVVNTSTGTTVERIDYDEFGNVTNDTAPGTIPFGFAGGLYEKDTGLVRFGARDYDPTVGRWTSKDPIRFRGGMNLYGYVVNDPINQVDVAGADPMDPSSGDDTPNAICPNPRNHRECIAGCLWLYIKCLAHPDLHFVVCEHAYVGCVDACNSQFPQPPPN
jgi:RHS repeat-associated protein